MAARSSLYDHLVMVARTGSTTTYGEVAELLGLEINNPQHRERIIRLLLDIACNESAEGRPLLSIVVVQSEIGYPGRSFFLLARELGTNNCCDDRSFFSYELKRVHDYWRTRMPEFRYQPAQMAHIF
jgi:hypothetical protein